MKMHLKFYKRVKLSVSKLRNMEFIRGRPNRPPPPPSPPSLPKFFPVHME